MAKILFAWELGLGFGHLSIYLDLIRRLHMSGHKIFFASRDVGNTERVLGGLDIVLLQAPFPVRPVANPLRKQYTYAHFLHNVGFDEPVALAGRIKAWRQLYEYVKPDVVIMDHSPTAQVAYLSLPAKKILSGTGFTLPPAESPMPNMLYWEAVDTEKLTADEQRIVDVINTAAKGLKIPQVTSIAQLFKANATLLLTFQELDHYPRRADAEYLGIPLQADFGQKPKWPAVNGKRVFAYLYPFRTLPSLLQTIAGSQVSAIVFAPEVKQAVKENIASPRIAYPDQPVRIMEVMQQCDIAVTNGTHATTATALLAGKPVLMMPNNLERFLGARRVVELGAGLSAPQLKPEGMAAKFGALLNSDRYAVNARKFAKTHADFNPERQLARMLEIVRSQL